MPNGHRSPFRKNSKISPKQRGRFLWTSDSLQGPIFLFLGLAGRLVAVPSQSVGGCPIFEFVYAIGPFFGFVMT